MNFFESQDRVRRKTGLLVGLFILAVVALIVVTNLLVMVVFGLVDSRQMRDGGTLIRTMDWQTFAAVGAGVVVVVLAGSLYKIMALSAGGKVVAESLGGRLVPRNTQDLKQRRLLNVVEEMAIASGTPAPPVYLLATEPGINAFAAGFSPRDAVIGVTQGAIDHLSREQLQGVIAHEFSHMFNGDMRLNIRLIGALHGILILGILGYYLLYSTGLSGRRRRDDRGAAAIAALALGLMVIGFAGTFFGSLIRAAVSRQREYLADASAVQFTRNPNGIAGALKRIGGLQEGSKVQNPGAAEVSHAFFAQGISGFMQMLSATHPPLAERIRRLDPQWDGKFESADRADAQPEASPAVEPGPVARQAAAERVATVAVGVAVADVLAAVDQVGNPKPEAVDHARVLLSQLPAAVDEAAREPYGARALIYSMLLGKDEEVRARQLEHLHAHADPDVHALTLTLLVQMDALDLSFRLPVIDIAMPALKQLSLPQYRTFRRNLIALIEMDARTDLLEWSLQKIVFRHLDEQFFNVPPAAMQYSDPRQLPREVQLVLSLLAHAGAESQAAGEEAFRAAAQALEASELALLGADRIRIEDLDRALRKLDALKPLAKARLLKACVASVVHDQHVAPVEVELLRAFSSALDSPLPAALA